MIRCHMQPGDGLLRALGRGHVDPRNAANISAALNDLFCVDKFSELLEEAMSKSARGDGSVDLKDVAAFCLQRMRDST